MSVSCFQNAFCILFWICLSKQKLGKNYFTILLYWKGSWGRPISHNFFALDTPISFSLPEVHFTCPSSLSLVMDKRGFFAGYELSGCCLERMGEWEGAIGILWPLPPSLSIVHSHQDWSGHQTPSQSLTIITCSVNTSIINKQLNFLHFGPIFLWKCFMFFQLPKRIEYTEIDTL